MDKVKILITGKGSFIGTSLIKWLKQTPHQYEIEELSVRGNDWEDFNFSQYDVVLHLAGIAHVSTDPEMEAEYYRINRDIAIKVAKKAKSNSVKQFILMSSIIVYGSAKKSDGFIEKDSIPEPNNFYGNSKLQAEEGVRALEDDNFKVAVLRPPMIYGRGSKGNYPVLAKFSRKLPVFPNIDNKRSMLHIDNLCEFIKLIVDNKEKGLFFPQNREHVNTSQMVLMIAQAHNKNIKLTKVFNPFFANKFVFKIGLVNKVFGNLAYNLKMSKYKNDYQIRSLRESIILTETIDKEG